MRSTEVQRKLTCSASNLATVPMAASSPTVAAVDRGLIREDAMGTLRMHCRAERAQGRLCRPGTNGPTRSAKRERPQNRSTLARGRRALQQV